MVPVEVWLLAGTAAGGLADALPSCGAAERGASSTAARSAAVGRLRAIARIERHGPCQRRRLELPRKSLCPWHQPCARRGVKVPDGHTRRSRPTRLASAVSLVQVSSLRARLGVSTALVIAAVVGLSTYLQARIVAKAVEAEELDAAAAIAL